MSEDSLVHRLRQFQADEPGFPPLFSRAAAEIESLRAQIAAAMDILEEIPGETLDERLKNLAAMVGPLVAAYRSATT